MTLILMTLLCTAATARQLLSINRKDTRNYKAPCYTITTTQQRTFDKSELKNIEKHDNKVNVAKLLKSLNVIV
jgi:hypothetical protein